MNELTKGETRRKGERSKELLEWNDPSAKIEGAEETFTSHRGSDLERSKRFKKMFDDSMAIFSVTQTSADASRYLSTVKAAGLTNRQSGLFQMERSSQPSQNKPRR
jgi:hypothetical protein